VEAKEMIKNKIWNFCFERKVKHCFKIVILFLLFKQSCFNFLEKNKYLDVKC